MYVQLSVINYFYLISRWTNQGRDRTVFIFIPVYAIHADYNKGYVESIPTIE